MAKMEDLASTVARLRAERDAWKLEANRLLNERNACRTALLNKQTETQNLWAMFKNLQLMDFSSPRPVGGHRRAGFKEIKYKKRIKNFKVWRQRLQN